MQKNEFVCPHCGHVIDLTDMARHEVDATRRELEKAMQDELKKKEEEIKKEMWIKAQSAASKKIEEENREKLIELENLRKRDEESRKKEIEFLRERAGFEQKQKDLELEKEKAVLEARKVLEAELAERVKKDQEIQMERIALEFEKKLQEKDKQIEQVQRSLEDANRKANQGSMQIQGDIQENALKDTLSREFPIDTVDDVPTGIKGADLIQTVRSEFGKTVGVIAWESKNTKAWSDSWVEKLKEDRLRVNASVSIIVSTTLPEGIRHFGLYKGIWVTEWSYVVPLAITLREQMSVIEHMK